MSSGVGDIVWALRTLQTDWQLASVTVVLDVVPQLTLGLHGLERPQLTLEQDGHVETRDVAEVFR